MVDIDLLAILHAGKAFVTDLNLDLGFRLPCGILACCRVRVDRDVISGNKLVSALLSFSFYGCRICTLRHDALQEHFLALFFFCCLLVILRLYLGNRCAVLLLAGVQAEQGRQKMSLRVENLSYTYPDGDSPVFRDLSFEAQDGCITIVVGANGVGKTTLIKSMLGINKSRGKVYLDGEDRSSFSNEELFKRVGYMTQESAILTRLNVFNVVLLGRLGSLSIKVQDEDIDKVHDMLKLLDIEKYAERPFYALSGGQRRLVDVAQTLVKDPKILIMDEPTANLDLSNELQVLEIIKEYTRQRYVTTLLTLHDLNMTSRYADKVVLIKDGRVFKEGQPLDVFTEESVRAAYGVNVNIILGENFRPVIQPGSVVEEKQYDFRRQ